MFEKIDYISQLDGDCFDTLLSFLPILDLFRARRVSRQWQESIDQFFRQVTSFRFGLKYNNYGEELEQSRGQRINMRRFATLVSQLPNLRFLKVADGFNYWSRVNCYLDVEELGLITQIILICPILEKLDVSNCLGLTGADYETLGEAYPQLAHLNVSGCQLDEVLLKVIVKTFSNLKYLNVANNFWALKGECLALLGDKIETFAADYNQNIRSVDGLIRGTGRHVTRLEINVGHCYNTMNPYCQIAEHIKDLKAFKCHYKTRDCVLGRFKPLAALSGLETLHIYEEIDDFNVSSSLDDDSVLEIMKGCPLLEELVLHAGAALWKEMQQSRLTDASIGFIDQYCPLLKRLSIRRAAITDISLQAISRLKYADEVQLVDLAKITPKGIQSITSSFKIPCNHDISGRNYLPDSVLDAMKAQRKAELMSKVAAKAV